MLRSVFYAATYWLPVLLILLIVIARMAAPFPYCGTDYDQAIEESLIAAAMTDGSPQSGPRDRVTDGLGLSRP
jgi:hypothetical protein